MIDDKKIINGEITRETISDGKIGVVHGINGHEMNTIIKKYDEDGYLEWTRTFDRDSTNTDDCLTGEIEVDDGYVMIGKSFKTIKNSHNEEIIVEDAIILKYNKAYDGIVIMGSTLYEMNVGQKKAVNLYYLPWEDVTIGEMQWISENENVATVDYKGNITAHSEGTTNIILNIRGKTQKIKVTVTDPNLKHIEFIELNYNELTLNKGEKQLLNVIITPEDTTDNKTVTWNSSNNKVATVTDGEVFAVSEGTAIITAEIGDKSATCEIRVNSSGETIKGDINGDGITTLYDAFSILRMIILSEDIPEEKIKIMDFNNDGIVTLYDAFTCLRQVILN